ncbi:amidohydrolase family protein, partial [Klebsiella pneumoniae]|nr:amidohydrolase family protein [Klebsiella pneumoniae]
AYGDTPVNVVKRNFEGIHTILAHGVKLDKKDIECLKEMDISVSHCPVSNLKLGCGIANISEMLDNGINVSL